MIILSPRPASARGTPVKATKRNLPPLLPAPEACNRCPEHVRGRESLSGAFRWLMLGLLAAASAPAATFTDPREAAAADPGFLLQGEYLGEADTTDGPATFGVQVAASGGEKFQVVICRGGLPGQGGIEFRRFEAEREGDAITVVAPPYRLRIAEGALAVEHEVRGHLGRLRRITRTSPTEGKPPPPGAVVLFDGSSTGHWRDGSMTAAGLLEAGAMTKAEFGDATLHVEFLLPYRPSGRDQGRANSGIYIQNRYEVQILDSFGLPPAINGAGSLYNFKAPELNMSYPPLTWQTYDIRFTAPKFDDRGEKTAEARITVEHNGVRIHDDVALPAGTGAGRARGEVARGPLLLQDHDAPVRFRNIWLVE